MSSRWKHWCHAGCGKKVVYIGWQILDYRYKCECCGKTYDDKEALKWENKID